MTVNLVHIIAELEEIQQKRKAKFDIYVQQESMTPYSRDSKLFAIDELIKICKSALKTKVSLKEALQELTDLKQPS